MRTDSRTHRYSVEVRWTGNTGAGTTSYRAYERSHEMVVPGKPVLTGSADPSFRGDASQWNPEELLVSALSQCHLLWYLHLAAVARVVVVDYRDFARGTMEMDPQGAGRFTEVVLAPVVTVREPAMVAKAEGLHERANAMCFIARSVNFPVRHEPTTQVAH